MELSEYVAARRPTLVRAAVLLGCPPSDAEDLVQTALLRCVRSWRRVSNARQPDAYVHRLLVNALRDARARRWNGELPTDQLPERPTSEVDLTSDLTSDLASNLATGLAVRHALSAMSAEHREVLVLRFYADLSERETADALRIPLGTVKSRTARALAALAADPDVSTVRSR